MTRIGDARHQASAHLIPHFTRATVWRDGSLPIFVRGDGCYVYDDKRRRFLDGMAGLFCVNIGYGRADIATAAAKQMEMLAYATNWGAAHPSAIEAASLICELAPGDLEAVFFVNSGSEAVESAIKFVRQYHRQRNQPRRTKIVARNMAYHGTTLGALSVTGLPNYKAPFEPLLPDIFHVPNTLGEVTPAGGSAGDLPSIKAIRDLIEREGPDTIAAIFAEPVQNGRGALVPPDGYWQELRDLCNRFDILLVADEVINAFGRLGHWFGSQFVGVVPDLITFAKGATSGYAPLGGLIVRRELADTVFSGRDGSFVHGATWGGHPVATAVAIANITAMRDEGVLDNVRSNESHLRDGLAAILAGHRIVKEVRGAGYFYAIELTANRDDERELTGEQSQQLLRTVLPDALRRSGLISRPDDRGATMLMISPPLVADRAVLSDLLDRLEAVMAEAEGHVPA